MQFTPTKQPIISSQNQRCKVPLTSANKIRRITVSPNAVIREVIEQKKNYAPLVNITPQLPKKYEEFYSDKNQNCQKERQLFEENQQLHIKLEQGIFHVGSNQNEIAMLKSSIDQDKKRILNKKQRKYAIKQAIQRKQKIKLEQFVVHARKLQRRRQMYINIMDARGKQDEKVIRTIDKFNKFTNKIIDIQKERAVAIQHNEILTAESTQMEFELDAINLEAEQKMNQLADAMRKLEENLNKIFDQEFQVAILKMQLSPNLKVGFDAVINEQDKETLRRLLQNQSLNWPKINVKQLSMQQMRYYILIQLYPKWQNILTRLSYNFIGYRQIFGEKCPSQKQSIFDMANYVQHTNGVELKSKKTKNSVILVSKLPNTLHKLRQLFYDLQTFDNNILRIHSIQEQITSETSSTIRINYTFYGQQRKKQFQIIWVQDVNIEIIKKIAHQSREGERIILNIEVPLVCSSHSELQSYTAIWQFCKKT